MHKDVRGEGFMFRSIPKNSVDILVDTHHFNALHCYHKTFVPPAPKDTYESRVLRV